MRLARKSGAVLPATIVAAEEGVEVEDAGNIAPRKMTTARPYASHANRVGRHSERRYPWPESLFRSAKRK
jgi:hypothetical protein